MIILDLLPTLVVPKNDKKYTSLQYLLYPVGFVEKGQLCSLSSQLTHSLHPKNYHFYSLQYTLTELNLSHIHTQSISRIRTTIVQFNTIPFTLLPVMSLWRCHSTSQVTVKHLTARPRRERENITTDQKRKQEIVHQQTGTKTHTQPQTPN